MDRNGILRNRRPAIIRGMDQSGLHELEGEDEHPARSVVDPKLRAPGSAAEKKRSLAELLGAIPNAMIEAPDSSLVRLAGGCESNLFAVSEGTYGYGSRRRSGEGPDFSDCLSGNHERVIETICSVGGMPG